MAQDIWRRSGAQDPGRNDQTLDFAGPFVDFGDARIAVVALYRVFAAVAVAAVDLNRFVRDARGHFAGKQLGEGGVHGEAGAGEMRSEEHTSELQSRFDLVCRLLLEKKKK